MHISSIHVMLVPVYLSTIPLTSILKHIQCVELYKWICKTRDASYLLGLLILSQPCMHSFWVELCDTVLARANLLVDPLKHQSDFCLVYPVDAPPLREHLHAHQKIVPTQSPTTQNGGTRFHRPPNGRTRAKGFNAVHVHAGSKSAVSCLNATLVSGPNLKVLKTILVPCQATSRY